MEDQSTDDELNAALDALGRAVPDQAFMDRLEEKAVRYVENKKQYRPRILLAWAAAACLLVLINLTVIKQSSFDSPPSTAESETGYELIPLKSINYE